MDSLKIITHTFHTYETTDGREFDDSAKALAWQQAINLFKNICMLDYNLKITSEVDKAFFVHIKNHKELEAFNDIRKYEGLYAKIPETGYYLYDDTTDDYINIENKIKDLQTIIEQLKMLEG
jgi:hypothetical protein